MRREFVYYLEYGERWAEFSEIDMYEIMFRCRKDALVELSCHIEYAYALV